MIHQIWSNIFKAFGGKNLVFEFLKEQDIITVALPQRYFPLIPSSLGYLYEIFKPLSIKHQEVDLNIELYHNTADKSLWEGAAGAHWEGPECVETFGEWLEEKATAIVAADPKILGVSITGTNRMMSKALIKRVRELNPNIIILAGGYDCCYAPIAVQYKPECDYIVVGEAEEVLPSLILEILDGKKPANTQGVISINDSESWETNFIKGQLPHEMDKVGFPRYEWTDMNLYKGAEIPTMGSRGCSWSRCRFCSEAWFFRQRSATNMADEMQYWVEKGFNSFVYGDAMLSGDVPTFMKLCDEIHDRRLKVKFRGQIHVNKHCTYEFFSKMKNAGFNNARIGVDAWSNNTLRVQNKGYTTAKLKEVLGFCSELGITTLVNLVLGVPGETEEDIDECIANMRECKDLITHIENINMLMLSHGSEFYHNPEKYGIKFRGKKEDIYNVNPAFIPKNLWYTENPYIDADVRLTRMKRIYEAIESFGVPVSNYVKWQMESGRTSTEQE